MEKQPIRRRAFLQIAALGSIAVPRPARAQRAGKVHRIAMLGFGASPPSGLLAPFLDALRIAGWVEGRDFVLEFRATEGDPVRADAAARELVAMKVDLIVTAITGNAVAAKRATVEIPIVMMTSGYPVEIGLVKSYARPGGNVTGNTVYAGTGLFAKHVEILKEAVPRLARLAVLWSYVPPIVEVGEGELGLAELKQAASRLGVTIRLWQTRKSEDVESALLALSREHADALYVTAALHEQPDAAARIVEFAQTRRMPTITDFATHLFRAGILMTYSANPGAIARQTANFVDRILRGARPHDLPIERPSTFDLIINLKIAKSIGLAIPPSLLLRADQIIE